MRVSEDEVKRVLVVSPYSVGPIQVVALYLYIPINLLFGLIIMIYYVLAYNEKVCQARASANPMASPVMRATPKLSILISVE